MLVLGIISVDSCTEISALSNSVTYYGRVWRKGVRKRGSGLSLARDRDSKLSAPEEERRGCEGV